MKNLTPMKRFFVHIFLPLLCFALLLGPLTPAVYAASDVTARLRPDITIVIDGAARVFYNVSGQQVHPISYNNTTYLPLRAIGELMGKVVTWNKDTKTASLGGVRTEGPTAGTPDAAAKAKNVTVELRNDITVVVDDTARTFTDANGKTVYPLLYQGSTYLPIRAIGELMGKRVDWDGKTNTVTLSGGDGGDVTDADVIVGGDTGPSGARPILTLEEAKAKALAHAGLKADQVTFTEAKLDWDDGKQVYDIEFYTADFKEYDYEIDAKTGEVLEVDYDAESFTPPASSGTVITREKAQEIALAKVPGADASHIKKLKLDKDDGKQVYDVEIIYNGMEHEMEIDAVTGKILEYEMDRD